MIWKQILLIILAGVTLTNSMNAEDKKSKNQVKNMKPFPTEICELKTKQDLLEKCVGKRVKIKGTIAKTILDPDVKYPDLSSIGGYINQYHIDTSLGQLGLISQKPIECIQEVVVEGILHVLSPDTNIEKATSQKPYIQVLMLNCK